MSASPKKTKKRNMNLERARRQLIRKAQREPGVSDLMRAFKNFSDANSVIQQAEAALQAPSFGTNSTTAV